MEYVIIANLYID